MPAGSRPAPPAAMAGSCSAAVRPFLHTRSPNGGPMPRSGSTARRWPSSIGWPTCSGRGDPADRLDPAGRPAGRSARSKPRPTTAAASWPTALRTRRPCARTASRSRTTTASSAGASSCPTMPPMNPAVRAIHVAARLADGPQLYEHTAVTAIRGGHSADTARGTVSAGVVIVAVDGRLELLVPAAGRRGPHGPAADAAHCPGRAPAALPGVRRAGATTTPRATRPGGCSSAAAAIDSSEPEWTLDADPTGAVQDYIEAGRGPVRRRHR